MLNKKYLQSGSVFTKGFSGASGPPATEKILFTSDQGGTINIWMMNPDGTGQTNITSNLNGTGFIHYGLGLSPDFKKLCWNDNSNGSYEMYICDIFSDGSAQNITQISSETLSDANNYAVWFNNDIVLFTGGGDRKVMRAYRVSDATLQADIGDGGLGTSYFKPGMGRSPSNCRVYFTYGLGPGFEGSWAARWGDFSPTTLLLSNHTDLTGGANTRNLANFIPSDKILFAVGPSGATDLIFYDTFGTSYSNPRNYDLDSSIQTFARYSPNKDFILYTSLADGDFELYKKAADGNSGDHSDRTKLTNNAGPQDVYADWGCLLDP